MRAANGEDAAALFVLVKQFPTPTPCSHETFCALLDSKLRDQRSCLIVAEHDGALVGYVSGSVRTAFHAGGTTAWVDEILVAPDARGGGVGRHLMQEFELWAASHDAVLVALATHGAVKFYERLGYTSKAGYFKKHIAPAG
jgi:GNAT superfamily N-acetyltransferase